MLKLTRPKNGNQNLFYVSSESKPDSTEASHIVCRVGNLFFCDCRNYMTQKLPKLGTSGYTSCKHGEFVEDSVGLAEGLKQELVSAILSHFSPGGSNPKTAAVVNRVHQLHTQAQRLVRKVVSYR